MNKKKLAKEKKNCSLDISVASIQLNLIRIYLAS